MHAHSHKGPSTCDSDSSASTWIELISSSWIMSAPSGSDARRPGPKLLRPGHEARRPTAPCTHTRTRARESTFDYRSRAPYA
eukprot:5829478-Pleurochrysis_carterae.AAC.2